MSARDIDALIENPRKIGRVMRQRAISATKRFSTKNLASEAFFVALSAF